MTIWNSGASLERSVETNLGGDSFFCSRPGTAYGMDDIRGFRVLTGTFTAKTRRALSDADNTITRAEPSRALQLFPEEIGRSLCD